jgi:hypothetical protein
MFPGAKTPFRELMFRLVCIIMSCKTAVNVGNYESIPLHPKHDIQVFSWIRGPRTHHQFSRTGKRVPWSRKLSITPRRVTMSKSTTSCLHYICTAISW